MTDVLERLRAANPVPPPLLGYPPEDVRDRVDALVRAPRSARGPLLAAAAVVLATAGVATAAAMVSWPSDRSPAVGGSRADVEVTVSCRAGTGTLSGARLDRATDVVENRLQTAGVRWGSLDTQPSSGFIDVTVPERLAGTVTQACHPTTVSLRAGRSVVAGSAGVLSADPVHPSSNGVEWGVRVTFTPAVATAIRRHASEHVALLVDSTVVTSSLPRPDRSGAVTITGGYDLARAQQLADDIAGAAAGVRPVP